MYFPLDKLLDYKGNRYELARACMEYAKKVRSLGIDEYIKANEKDALVALRAILEKEIHFASDELQSDDLEELDDFLAGPEQGHE